MSASSAAAEKAAPKSFARRDHLRELEVKAQKKWENLKINDVERDSSKPKFMITFPYPYMNGRLHLGHAYSLTKAEFTARFQRLLGKNVLFPFAFHCTGMPIQAAANKLKEEIEKYGCPPVFPAIPSSETSEAAAEKSSSTGAEQQIAAKSKGKKTKLAVKGQSGPTRQWDILKKMVPEEDIPSFADPMKWLTYFPPLGVDDMRAFGVAVDWRRSFITTAVNQYYDAFIRWQFNLLHGGGKIKSGYRPNVYSVKDGQVCADHDRASGEAVVPQEYTLIKLLVKAPYPAGSVLNDPQLSGKQVFLAPATLRPETMYGQTNCFVLPEGEYGAFEFVAGEVLIMSKRSAVGLAHQGYSKELEWGKTVQLLSCRGSDLLGLPLVAPNAAYEVVYTLPLATISMGKGTGVVTSVPSDAPDDYATLKELKDKPLWREKFGITAEMVDPFEVVPIIEIPGYGDKSAVTMYERLDIKSPKDAEKLKIAKDEVYLKGFYEGVMLIGECKGMKVCDAKPIIRAKLIEEGKAISYYEPESTVMSRSGEECIVALTDQWYLAYGDPEWQGKILDHLHSSNFNPYNASVLDSFEKAIAWLKEWACSREFGLGTQLPWEEKWVIDSLSDSTIYMAYYTIAHLLHGSGSSAVLSGNNAALPEYLAPQHFTDDVFSFIFLGKELPSSCECPIPSEVLQSMRSEFEYWYPMDLRVSAKDLIPNHLTMCLYNHVEIWKDRPEMWPRGIFCNGHIMVDAEKMSKSKGNFLMLLECVEEYSADATRFALADAGDTLEDANFDRSVANQACTYLFTEEEWIKSVIAEAAEGKLRDSAPETWLFMDRAVSNETEYLIDATFQEFSKMCYRDGIHRCWFDMMIVRDFYRDWSLKCGFPMQRQVVMRLIEAVVVMMQPICPHWSEHIWELLGKTGSVCDATWPTACPCDKTLRKEFFFFRDFLKNLRQGATKLKLKGGLGVHVYIAAAYEERKITVLEYMQRVFEEAQARGEAGFPKTFPKDLKVFLEADPELKPHTKVLMQFGAFMRDEAQERGADALTTTLSFDQAAILEENAAYVSGTLNLVEFKIFDCNAEGVPGERKKIDAAAPGKPSFSFYSVA